MAAVTPPSNSLLSRFKGCLAGAVIGDCLGSAFENTYRPDFRTVMEHFEKVDHPKSPVTPKISFTDDTAMARSVAQSLIDNKGFEALHMAKRFASEYQKEHWRGYGDSVIETIQYFSREDINDALYAHAQTQFGGSGSYGNGGAMRVMPASLFGYHYSKDVLTKLVKDMTTLTHTHKHGVNGAILQAHAVHAAIHTIDPFDPKSFLENLANNIMEPLEHPADDGTRMDSLKHPADERTRMDSLKFPADETERTPCYSEKLKKAVQLLNRDDTIETVRSTLGTGVEALESVPTAVYCFARAATPLSTIAQRDNPFERTIIYAVLLGGDTDTIGSMAGAIAGAYYGIENINNHWLDHCEGVNDAIQEAEELYKVVNNESKETSS